MHPPLPAPSALLTVLLLLVATLSPAVASAAPALPLDAVKQAPASVVTADGTPAPADVKVVRDWSGAVCRARVVNDGKAPVRVKEVVLLDLPHAYPPETHLYGEGFTMLSETTGTLGQPVENFLPPALGLRHLVERVEVEAADVRVRVMDGDTPVATVRPLGTLDAGPASFTWGGRNRDGALADGDYRALVEATTTLGTRTLSVPLRIDTRAPVVRWAMPYEQGRWIWICRDPSEPLEAAWADLKHYE